MSFDVHCPYRRARNDEQQADERILFDVIRIALYAKRVIKGFRDKATRALFGGNPSRRFRSIAKVASRKLDMLDAATRLADLSSPPGNRLEALKGGRKGQHSIRINDQWRICFVWNDGAEDVEIVDYHR
jgi:proteic killer suppression protein